MGRGRFRTVVLWLLAVNCPAQIADFAIANAHIYTVDPERASASAIALKDGKILALGDDISRHIGPQTKLVDARGATILPGLIDSHVHMRNLGDSLETLNLRGAASEAEIIERVRRAVHEHKPGDWIRGRAWDQNLWPDKQFPTAQGLSQAAPNNPVFLTRVDGHAAWVNQKALDLADINGSTPDPHGGKILRTSSGKPTGVLIDGAQALAASKIPNPTPEDNERRIARAAEECVRLGLTTVHDAGVDAADIAAYRALISKHQLPVRVYAMLSRSAWNASPTLTPELGDWLTIRAVKLVADGALGSRGAALLQPYSDDPANSGLLILDEAAIRQVALDAVKRGFQVNTHAIGDRANRIVLNAYASALKGRNDKRFRVEHAQIVAPEDFARFRDYSVIASMQATHATSDMPWVESRLGAERLKGAYAWQTFLKLGVHVPNGSDFPVENPNPLWGIYSAVTRQDHEGKPPGGWFPDQRMTREQALKSWTIEGAYAAFQERTRGSLSPGKLADLVMLSGDIMQMPAAEIWKTRVTMTVVNGAIVYKE
ncbi:MAG: amidohydrolase [Acidobacteriota bacterium]|nr:amidohydrolase [Acidobacteriota bacterium]